MAIDFVEAENWIIAKPDFQRLDGAVAQEFTQTVVGHCKTNPDVILDLRNVTFIDSRGLSSLIAILKGLPSGARLRLANINEQVDILLTLTRMNTLLTPFLDVETAMQG